MTIKEYCDSCQNKGSHKCHSCMVKYFDGVLQGKPTKYREKPQTNADRIRAMSDEELANWLGCTIADTVWDELGKRGVSFSRRSGIDACDQLLDWLKQPAEE